MLITDRSEAVSIEKEEKDILICKEMTVKK